MKILAVALAMLGGAAARAAVQPLTPETAAGAITHGQAVAKSSKLCFSDDLTTGVFKTLPPRGFSLVIETPLCGLAIRAFEAKRKYDPPPGVADIPPPEDQVVTVSVDPSSFIGAGFAIAGHSAKYFASVEKVVLKRGAEIIQPVKSDSRDVAFSNAYGKTVVYKGGRFSFPLSAFDPAKGGTLIVVVLDSGVQGDEVTKWLTPEDLAKLQ